MHLDHFFSDDSDHAVEQFLAACARRGVKPDCWVHPLRGPAGQELRTHAAWFGPADALNLIVLVSGVHGVEAFAGSGAQVALIEQGMLEKEHLPPSTAVLMIHLINCWGAAHGRRNTDGNVDLCRNFVDFGEPLPVRPEYEDIHPALVCPTLEGPARDGANQRIERFVAQKGPRAYIQALMGGQYQHPDGFSYGGNQPTWSRRVLEEIFTRYTHLAKRVAVIEYHTGLGPWAYGTAVTMHMGNDCQRARRWYGNWLDAPNERNLGASLDGYRVFGHTTEGYKRLTPDAELTAIVLEFGTYPPEVSLPVMVQDHWLEVYGDPSSDIGERIRKRMLELHHPEDRDWRQAVLDRANQVFRQALRGLVTA
ncbi:MAG: DUF2817 domain-containing protein [Betaproteobacteria bacterium]|jgi:hypothetical protein